MVTRKANLNNLLLKVVMAWAVIAVVVLVSISTALAQSTVKREIIAMFAPGVVQLTEGEVSAPVEEVQISSDSLLALLTRHKTELIIKAFPDYDPAEGMAVSPTGQVVRQLDLSRAYKIRLPDGTDRLTLVEGLSGLPEVLFAHRNGMYELHSTIPNDPYFDLQWGLYNTGQAGGTPGADIAAIEAWDTTTGNPEIHIGIIDVGVDGTHEDLSGKVFGDQTFSSSHGTHVAGIAAAKTNNGIGISGTNWHALLWSEDISGFDEPVIYDALLNAVNSFGCQVLNNSWGGPEYSVLIRSAFAYTFKMGSLAIVSMGNDGTSDPMYPAAFGQGILAVGVLTNRGGPTSYSNMGLWMDVAAPGGEGPSGSPKGIYSTLPDDNYGYKYGTSMAAPFVSGVAGLVWGMNRPFLVNDDVERIIQYSADDILPSGRDEYTGFGALNVANAVEFINSHSIYHWTKSGGYEHSHTGAQVTMFYCVPGLADGAYLAKRYDVRKDVTFLESFSMPPYAWGRGDGSVGYSGQNPNFGLPWCDVIPGSITENGCTLRTHVYKVWNMLGQFVGWFPCEVEDVKFEYTVMDKIAVGVESEPGIIIPKHFALSQNYPNPFNPTTTIQYTLPQAAEVNLSVYNIAGEKVAELVNGFQEAGLKSVRWDAGRMASGIYFYRIRAGEFIFTRKMLLLQ